MICERKGIDVSIALQLTAKLLLVFFLAILEAVNHRIKNGVHLAVISRRVLALAAIPDFSELYYVSSCEDRPFKQLMLQLR